MDVGTAQTCSAKGNIEVNLGRLAAGASNTVTFNLKTGSAGASLADGLSDATCQTGTANF